ncbi:MAG: long-chain fatty acid--CoA ligase [Acidobacteriota bacterium]|nr:long-chain fatty acid--CoA ligase [Acidobacteriota bacterium]
MVETLSQLFMNTIASYPKDDLFLCKIDGTYAPISSAEADRRVRSFSLGLRELGLQPGDKVILLSENRPEWAIADFAIMSAGAATVPVYTSLTPEQIKYIINDSEAKIVICSNRDLWLKVEAIRGGLPKVSRYILIEDDAAEGVLTMSEVMGRGAPILAASPRRFDDTARLVNPGDLASIIYTSGTTGVPKGVMLSHGNFMSNIRAMDKVVSFTREDTILSFLPLSHVLERMTTFSFLYNGATIAYAESIDTVAQNLLEVRPTIMVSVPRLFDKIYTRVIDNVLAGSPVKRKLFFWALNTGKKHSACLLEGRPVPASLRIKRGLAAKLVFSKITAKTGGRIRFFVSGGAPLSRDIAEFFHAMGLVILEGYGLTETAPVLAVNSFEKLRFGTVGAAAPGVELKIAEDGEILARGPNVMLGYYKKEAETREVMAGGWFHTGDIGHFDKDGFLVITDRKKDLIVTAGGKNVAPQPIENLLKANPYILNSVVVGQNRKFVSALVVPDFDKLAAYAKDNGIAFEGPADLVKKQEIVDFMTAEVNRSTPDLAPYERIKKIALLDKDFDAEFDELTPTLKVKRNVVEKNFKPIIDALYIE